MNSRSAYIDDRFDNAGLQEANVLLPGTIPESQCDSTCVAQEVVSSLNATDVPAGESSQRFVLRSVDQVLQVPLMKWAVHGLLPIIGVAAFYGVSGSAKTFLCIHLAAKLAEGKKWFGRVVPSQLRVIYVALEGQWGFPLRLRAWAENYQQQFPDGVKFVFEPLAINREDESSHFAEWIKQQGGADVIFVDTLNRASPGADENRSADMGKIIAGASLIQQKTGALVILVHHSGKDESRGLRGHSSLYAALDAVIEVKRDSSNKRWWRLEKAKDGEDGVSQSFELVPSDLGKDDYGLPLTSMTVRELEGTGPVASKVQSLGKNQAAVLAQFKLIFVGQAIASGGNVANQPGIPFNDCVKLCKDCVDVKDARHRTERVKEALNSLIKSGHIVESGELLTLPS